MASSRIFVLNRAGHDYTPAKKFGEEIIPLTIGNINIFNIERNCFMLLEKLIINNYDPEKDYLVLSGNLILGFSLGMVMGKIYQKIRVLVFDSSTREYNLKEINLQGLEVALKDILTEINA